MEEYGFGIEEIKIRMVLGVKPWLGTAGVSCGFFHDVSTQSETVEESAALGFCRRVQPLGGFRIYHCSKDIQTQGTPRHQDLQKLILLCLQ